MHRRRRLLLRRRRRQLRLRRCRRLARRSELSLGRRRRRLGVGARLPFVRDRGARVEQFGPRLLQLRRQPHHLLVLLRRRHAVHLALGGELGDRRLARRLRRRRLLLHLGKSYLVRRLTHLERLR